MQLGRGIEIPILFEDRSVLAIDKPAGWMLAPSDWDRTARNLQLAIASSIRARDFWAKSRNLKFLRFVHRLDAETTGVLLLVKSAGAVPVYSRLFESRQMEKTYLAVVAGQPEMDSWTSREALAPDPGSPGRMRVDKTGKEASTRFDVIQRGPTASLVRAQPLTGRTHQIRVHLADSGHPVLGDALYGRNHPWKHNVFPLGLRAVHLAYSDPFTRRRATINAPSADFTRSFGFPA